MKRTCQLLALVTFGVCALSAGLARAQSSDDSVTGFIRPVGDLPDRDPLPRFVLRPLHEIPLPGPLAGSGPVLLDGRITIPVTGGTASASWSAGATPEIVPAVNAGEPAEPIWVEAPGERRRYGTLREGWLHAQKSCKRCPAGWRTIWKLRVAGGTVSPPVVTKDRIFFGALDNRVYSLKRRNGHQRWVTTVEGRVSVSPLFIPLAESDPRVGDALVVVPGNEKVVVLGTRRGDPLGRLELESPDDRLVGAPVLTPDGHIAFALQRYRDEDACLLVYNLERAGDVPPP